MEIWKDVVGFEGLYQVSSLGNVKSMDRITAGGKHIKERILKLQTNTHGYRIVVLRKDKRSFTKEVHRFVAIAFIPNPDNLPLGQRISNIGTDYAVEIGRAAALLLEV